MLPLPGTDVGRPCPRSGARAGAPAHTRHRAACATAPRRDALDRTPPPGPGRRGAARARLELERRRPSHQREPRFGHCAVRGGGHPRQTRARGTRRTPHRERLPHCWCRNDPTAHADRLRQPCTDLAVPRHPGNSREPVTGIAPPRTRSPSPHPARHRPGQQLGPIKQHERAAISHREHAQEITGTGPRCRRPAPSS